MMRDCLHKRSGNQHQTGTKTMGNLAAASHDRQLAFAYKYVVGYCRSGKGSGTGPKLTITVGGTEVWSRQLQLSSEDYPYDGGCGGRSNNYSPTQSSAFKVPANVGGSAVLKMQCWDRNIHVVGEGISCSSGGVIPHHT